MSRIVHGSPVFIVGCSRSGTTMLRLMLTSHPQLSIPPESMFITKLFPKWGERVIQNEQDIDNLLADLYQSGEKFLEWGICEDDLRNNLRLKVPFGYATFVDCVYTAYARANHPTAEHWGDKNPDYVHVIDRLQGIFPNARFIHLIRDGRAVYNSFLSANEKHGRLYPEQPWKAAKKWLKAIKDGRLYYNSPNYLEVYYDNILRDPDAELANICEFLELPFHPKEMLNFYNKNKGNALVPKNRLEWHRATLRPIDQKKKEQWKHELPWWKILCFELCSGYHLETLGYRLVYPLTRFSALNKIMRWITS